MSLVCWPVCSSADLSVHLLTYLYICWPVCTPAGMFVHLLTCLYTCWHACTSPDLSVHLLTCLYTSYVLAAVHSWPYPTKHALVVIKSISHFSAVGHCCWKHLASIIMADGVCTADCSHAVTVDNCCQLLLCIFMLLLLNVGRLQHRWPHVWSRSKSTWTRGCHPTQSTSILRLPWLVHCGKWNFVWDMEVVHWITQSSLFVFFVVPMPPHVPYGLRGPPSQLWLKCNRLLMGRPLGAVTLSW
jgi:hypothetical protein